MKKIAILFQKIFPAIILTIIILCFFSRLFFPKLSLFITPDFGQSDILHGYYPIKYQLWSDLQKNNLPIWSDLEATGYPLFADGQIGGLVITNLILFKFLSFPLAINFGYVLIFFIAGIGTYLFCRELNLKKIPSLLAGLVFSLSGFNIGQITHISLLQSASFMPLEFYFAERILKNKRISDVLWLSITLSQQILCGHQQMTVYSITSLFIYILIRILISNKVPIKKLVMFFVAILLGIIMSSGLLFPSIELFKLAGGRSGIDVLNQFPYPLSNLLTFLNPYFFGNPKLGTYPIFNSNWGIFWENTGYVGLLPLICLGLSLFFIKEKQVKVFLIIFIFSLLLVLGKYSPLYFLFNFPPLNMFRVPSRFLLLTDFSLAIITALVVNNIFLFNGINKKFKYRIVFLLIIFQTINIFYYFYNYHPVAPAKEVLAIPSTANYLKNKDGRLYGIENFNDWNIIFLKKGWQKSEEYIKFRQGIYEHSNLLYQIPKANYFVQFPTKRMQIVEQLYSSLATSSAKFMGANSIKYILLPNSIKITNLSVDKKIENYTIYKNQFFTPRAHMVYDTQYVETLDSILDLLRSEEYLPTQTAIIENKNLIQNNSGKNSISWIKDSDNNISLKVITDKEGLLVLADTYYPGWEAYIDGKKTEIYPVNINQRGIKISTGSHNVSFIYKPISFRLGLLVTLTSYFLIIVLLIKKAFLLQ